MFVTTIACTQKSTAELSYGHSIHSYNGICHTLEHKHAPHMIQYIYIYTYIYHAVLPQQIKNSVY
jgi:hypothetical protein